ncbi:hypothetical protein CIW54_23330 [Paraburkholderia sp. T12-10]|nr:hypothetical protein CIW54_23330 [Paraburkholderia sp. T12-10]
MRPPHAGSTARGADGRRGKADGRRRRSDGGRRDRRRCGPLARRLPRFADEGDGCCARAGLPIARDLRVAYRFAATALRRARNRRQAIARRAVEEAHGRPARATCAAAGQFSHA